MDDGLCTRSIVLRFCPKILWGNQNTKRRMSRYAKYAFSFLHSIFVLLSRIPTVYFTILTNFSQNVSLLAQIVTGLFRKMLDVRCHCICYINHITGSDNFSWDISWCVSMCKILTILTDVDLKYWWNIVYKHEQTNIYGMFLRPWPLAHWLCWISAISVCPTALRRCWMLSRLQ